jgi:hypothetical protein
MNIEMMMKVGIFLLLIVLSGCGNNEVDAVLAEMEHDRVLAINQAQLAVHARTYITSHCDELLQKEYDIFLKEDNYDLFKSYYYYDYSYSYSYHENTYLSAAFSDYLSSVGYIKPSGYHYLDELAYFKDKKVVKQVLLVQCNQPSTLVYTPRTTAKIANNFVSVYVGETLSFSSHIAHFVSLDSVTTTQFGFGTVQLMRIKAHLKFNTKRSVPLDFASDKALELFADKLQRTYSAYVSTKVYVEAETLVKTGASSDD